MAPHAVDYDILRKPKIKCTICPRVYTVMHSDDTEEDEWKGAVCVPGDATCGAVWWSRLTRAVRGDPRGWFTHACILSGSLPVLLCCILYAGEYMGPTSTTLVCLCDALQCMAYYVWHWRVLRHNCFASSVSWLNRGMALLLYTVAIAFKLATPWCVVYSPDRTSAMGGWSLARISTTGRCTLRHN